MHPPLKQILHKKSLSAKKEERHGGQAKESQRRESEPLADLVQKMVWAGERPSMEGLAGDLAAMPLAGRQSALRSLQRTKGNGFVQRLAIQAKLTVGAAGDRYEQEADRVAEQVMRRIESPERVQRQETEEEDEIQTKPLAASITPLVQRLPTSTPFPQQPDEDEEEIQTKRISAAESFEAGTDFESRLSSAQRGGRPLPDSVRGQMEKRFGADFSGVRVHRGSEAAQLNLAVSAQAFTHGQDIYLSESKSNIESSVGKKLIAHELTHVIQQGSANITSKTAQQAPQGANTSVIQRWDEKEHKFFGDKAAEYTLGLVKSERLGELLRGGLKLGGEQLVSLGTTTQLGGDYSYTPEDLLKKTWLNGEGRRNYFEGVAIAGTNVNHFFPLASKEWLVHHNRAVDLALDAKDALDGRDIEHARSFINNALVTEGFANHFLQDSYAAGHQYPRALDEVGARRSNPSKPVKWTKEAVTGIARGKDFHDQLNQMTRGLPLIEGRFHGDSTRNEQDDRVWWETGKSLAKVLGAFIGNDLRQGEPHPSSGPNIPEIMRDNEAKWIWMEMTEAVNQDLKYAELFYNLDLETSAGTPYKASEITNALALIGWQRPPPGGWQRPPSPSNPSITQIQW
jgi:hypothetical protein